MNITLIVGNSKPLVNIKNILDKQYNTLTFSEIAYNSNDFYLNYYTESMLDKLNVSLINKILDSKSSSVDLSVDEAYRNFISDTPHSQRVKNFKEKIIKTDILPDNIFVITPVNGVITLIDYFNFLFPESSIKTILYKDKSDMSELMLADRRTLFYIKDLKYLNGKNKSHKQLYKILTCEKEQNSLEDNPYALVPLVVTLDISMSSTGVAGIAIDCLGNKEVFYGRIKSKPNNTIEERFLETVNNIPAFKDTKGRVLDLRSAKVVISESGALNIVRGAYNIGKYSGMLLASIILSTDNSTGFKNSDKLILNIAPTSLKKYVAGFGLASKTSMIKSVKSLYSIKENINDDIADALGLLWCYLDKGIRGEVIKLNSKAKSKAKNRRKARLSRATRRKSKLTASEDFNFDEEVF